MFFLREIFRDSFCSKETSPLLRAACLTCSLLRGPWYIGTDADMQVEKDIQRKKHWKRYFKGAATDLRYFARTTFSRSLVHKNNFSLT